MCCEVGEGDVGNGSLDCVCLSWIFGRWKMFGFLSCTVSVFMYMSLLLVAVNGCFPLTKTNEFPTLFIFFIANLIEMMTDVQ